MAIPALGFCNDLEALDAPNIVETGAGTGEWTATDPKNGTFTASFPAANNCSNISLPPNPAASVKCTLKLKGCGKLKITLGGNGSQSMPVVAVRRRSAFVVPPLTVNPWVQIMRANGPGGASCATGSLAPVVPSGALELEKLLPCGEELELSVTVSSYNRVAAITVTVTLEVITA